MGCSITTKTLIDQTKFKSISLIRNVRRYNSYLLQTITHSYEVVFLISSFRTERRSTPEWGVPPEGVGHCYVISEFFYVNVT